MGTGQVREPRHHAGSEPSSDLVLAAASGCQGNGCQGLLSPAPLLPRWRLRLLSLSSPAAPFVCGSIEGVAAGVAQLQSPLCLLKPGETDPPPQQAAARKQGERSAQPFALFTCLWSTLCHPEASRYDSAPPLPPSLSLLAPLLSPFFSPPLLALPAPPPPPSSISVLSLHPSPLH